MTNEVIMNKMRSAQDIQKDWDSNPRWKNVKRDYSAEEVAKLSGSVNIEYSLAKQGAEKLWDEINNSDFVNALGALTGNQAMQQAKAGLRAVYLSGWQVAGDANTGMQMYPDQSLYPVDSVPSVVKRINNSLRRADQLNIAEGNDPIDYMLPIVADAEAGFGGVLNAHELMKAMIEAGAAGVHFEDQLASAKKCGHMGGKVLGSYARGSAKTCRCKISCRYIQYPNCIISTYRC
jgi:isocitrate lyase